MKKTFIGGKSLVLRKNIRLLIEALNNKRMPINKFALQFEETPLYIVYIKIDNINSKIIITDISSNSEISKTIKCQINDSMTCFLFILSLIRDEYTQKVLFTEKSQL